MTFRKWMIGVAAAAAIGAGAISCGGDSDGTVQVAQGTVIRNVTIVDTRTGALTQQAAIVVDAGKIQRIAADSAVVVSGTAQSVDGTGKYVVPGYNDMHTHAMVAVDQTPTYWPLLIANGVTGIREAGGSAALIQRAQKLNADRAAGTVDAPEILTIPSDIFGGQATTAAGATAFVQQKKADGAGFIKITAGSRDAYLGVLAEAKNQGLDSAGHLSPAVSALESTNAGMKSIEHLGAGWGLILDCAADEANIRTAALAVQGQLQPLPPTYVVNPRAYDGRLNAPFYQRILDTYSDAKCGALAQAFVKNGTWQAVTLIRLRTQNYGNDPLYTLDPNLQYVDRTRRALWDSVATQFTSLPLSAIATLHQYYAQQLRVVKMMKQAGVKIVAGSDLGGQWVVPGFSLHQEFRELTAAGLSPLEILQTTTLNAAEFLHRESTMGSVEAGKNADLVVLDANPIDDPANLDKISAVFLRGKYLSKDALEQLKSGVATAYAAQPLQALHTALDLTHVD